MTLLILVITVTTILGLFFGYPGYLVWGILCTLPFWLPNSGDIISDTKGGWKYKYAKGYNNSNPLYVRGCLRKKKKSFVFGSVKGLFVCQIVALIIIVFAWIYLVVSSIYGEIVWIEKKLVYSSTLLLFVWVGLELYYQKCCDWSYRYIENAEGIWMPFYFLYRKYASSLYNNSFSCRYYVPYEEMKEKLQLKAGEKGYVPSKSYKTDIVKEFKFLTRRSGGALDILALIHIEQMYEGCWDIFNNVFELFWKETIAGKYDKRKMAFTFLICVDEDSEELRKIKKQMWDEVDSKDGRYRLSALLDYSDDGCLYIASDCERNGNNKRCRQIRKDLLSMLGISMKFDGKEYPERKEEK